jgi:alkanesulfonate monooxygenase SsuD/methylene tetrahydromethanopterin reductase-like flavin-dependent oxidoreductase (luciferase family)
MQLGTGLFTCQQRPDDDRSGSARYAEMLELASEIEAAGLDSAWLSEHHFQSDDYLSGVSPALGALAAETDRIEIGSCIALAPLYDSVRLAEDAATIDLLSEGRLTLGMAIGSNPREFDEFGVPRDERVERLEDAVRVCRGAWSDGPLDYDPDFHDANPDATVTPKPDCDIPVMLGGAAKPAVRRAARLGDGWCAPSKLSVGGVAKRHADVQNVRDDEGIDGDFTTYVLRHGFVADSEQEAWEQMKDGYFYLQRRYAEIFSGEPVDELDSERKQELKAQAVYGTPDQVIEELGKYEDAVGDDAHVILRTYYPGLDTDAMTECVHRLGDEVAPRL